MIVVAPDATDVVAVVAGDVFAGMCRIFVCFSSIARPWHGPKIQTYVKQTSNV
jgi:hypothetical protein